MKETTGTLDLKIARLENQLKVLRQQQTLSQAYPQHRANLIEQDRQIQFQLQRLRQHRMRILPSINELTWRLLDGNYQKQ
jgi:hypothetical protein